MPTLTASAPLSIRSFAPSAVATFPAMTWSSGYFSLIIFRQFSTLAECPWALSSTITSTLASTRAATRSSTLAVMPTPAPHRSLPWASFAARGYFMAFSMSLMVMRPFRLKSLSTMGSFSFLAFARICFASSSVMSSWAVISPSLVMDSLIFFVKSVSNFRSRLVMMPTSLRPSVTGTPEMRNFAMSASASPSVCSGVRENGSVMTPFSERFTLSTSSAWASMDMFLWMMPMPPCLAMAMAMRCSVTVSIPALIMGMFSLIFFVSHVSSSTWFGTTCEYAGTSSTSSKVMPSPIICPILSSCSRLRKSPMPIRPLRMPGASPSMLPPGRHGLMPSPVPYSYDFHEFTKILHFCQ